MTTMIRLCLWSAAFLMMAGNSYSQTLVTLIQDHLTRYPMMQVQDVYKMLYQGEFGVKHIIDNPETARQYLDIELEQVIADASEPLWEVIAPDSSIVRVNLRPFKANHLDPDNLWEAMLKTAETVTGDSTRLVDYWQQVMLAVEEGILPFPGQEAYMFLQTMQEHGLPAVHHSETYRAAYLPAYRVIAMDYLTIAVP
jgi:hypothetical protein